ncbi:efflux RND transporter periplasmic adaptor subunit [Candidatus Poribacteria bacterium]|nr:efflux RND transporter periplasmic adaptor subunit [Candidatus Poribacteria bacterium]MYB63217.1 efflux RND transporter periplasmic adaptor subunit [Candidatus Poribacteria bacterium]MYF57165.1 efflux RND transporter periplasmic adaptor subunit [Candidatus Poribacteria bacterium]
MKRYVHFTLSILTLSVFTLQCLFWSDTTINLVNAADEQTDSEIGEPHEHGEDDTHAHAEDDSVTLSDKAKANIGLKTAIADVRSIDKVVQVTGNIISHPGKRAVVTPRVGGTIKHVHAKLGDIVKKGDILLELESIDLQLAAINLIEAVQRQKSLDSTAAEHKSVFAKQILVELKTRQIDFLESIRDLQEQKNAFHKHRTIAIAKTISTLEQMRVELVKSDVERNLLQDTLTRIRSLTDLRVSAQKELITKQAEYTKATNVFSGTKRQFLLLGVSEQTVEKILSDDGSTPILTLLNSESQITGKASASKNSDALKYVSLIEEAAGLVDAELAYKSADIKVNANRQRVLAAGLTISQLETISKTGEIETFDEFSTEDIIEKYAPFMASIQVLEVLMHIEEAQRNAAILLAKVKSQLEVYGLTTKEIDEIIETGKHQSRFNVTAPINGQIIEQDATLGATIDKSESLYSILDTDVVWVEGEVYEDTLALIDNKLQVGSAVRIRIPAYPNNVFTGKITRISAVVNPEKRSVAIWTEVDNPSQQLKPGMFAEQTLTIEKLDDVLSVPLNAVIEDGSSQIVFVESGNTYIKHEVQVGVKDDQYIEIKEGLLAGEKVVIQGTHQLMRAAAGSTAVVDPHAGHSH